MHSVKQFWNSRYLFWAVLSVPAVIMIARFASGGRTAEELLHPSGEFAARLMIVAMMITPLRLLFPGARWLGWIHRRRRAIGVAAFVYAALHTLLYLVDMQTLRNILAEFWALGIWTGWAALLILIPLAGTSNDAMVRRLSRYWGKLHRWVYGAAMLTLIHWMFVHNNIGPALAHFAPLAALEAYRIFQTLKTRQPATTG